MTSKIPIIIPVYNQVQHTRQCLEKLFENTDPGRFELTVVDNASTDETHAVLQTYSSRISVIKNPVNMGFATACNQGARSVSGQYILFLNNDTEVQPGWLEPLIETLDSNPDIGAVGSRLLYPDGRLQHAGVIVISQKGVCSLLPRHVFMGEDPSSVPVDHPMYFQVLTAACLMFRKDVFDDLGGFDESYWNGCEDVDLCFRLHQSGKKLAYQPASAVIHHESVSGQERLVAQPRNNARLRARWENVIQPDIIQEGWIARRGPSRVIVPMRAEGPDPIEFLEKAAAWWTKREFDAMMAKENRQMARLTDDIKKSRQEIIQLNNLLSESRQENEQSQVLLAESQERLTQTTEELKRSRQENEQSQVLLAESQERLIQTTEELKRSRQENEQSQELLAESHRRLKQLGADFEESQANAVDLEKHIAELTAGDQKKADLLRALHNDFIKLLKSKRWQVGNAVIRFVEIMMFRPRVMLAADHMLELFHRAQESGRRATSDLEVFSNINNQLLVSDKDMPKLPVVPSTDIVICVHNALDDVRQCLESVVKNTHQPHRLFLVNDGSDVETTEYLRQFVQSHSQSRLLENERAHGYTRAANQGLRATTAEQVVLLNSDTIVPKMWLEALSECALSDPSIGIVGPMSNAASWQSLPRRFGPEGDWAVNDLPDGYTVDEMAELVYQMSDRRFPRVTFVNGFCFLIKRTVISSIGLLDEDAFPAGYGEENDYCLRAAQAGFTLAIADHGYIYHAKSKSYSHDRRLELSRIGGQALEKKHGSRIISQGTGALKNQADLAELRRKIRDYLEGSVIKPDTQSAHRLAIRFVLPAGGIGGGILSVVQEAVGISRFGHDVRILTRRRYYDNYSRFFPELVRQGVIFDFYEKDSEIESLAAQADVLIATTWDSPRMISSIVQDHPQILPAYYVQDYEPWFFPEGSPERQVAFDSYTLIPGMLCMVKTRWLSQTLEKERGVRAVKVSPGLDRKVFYPPETDAVQQKLPIKIVAMIRPDSPRRGAARTMRVLKSIQNRFAPVVRIHLFGCQDEDILSLEHGFSYRNHGVLKREEVAALYRESTLFVDFSDYQAFGRTGLEAMACGCVPILPVEGGVHEYAEHRKNALIVDTRDENQLVESLSSLLLSDSLRQNMRTAALQTANRFSVERAVLSELGAMRQALSERRNRIKAGHTANSVMSDVSGRISISMLLALRGDGKPCGSGHIRLLNPLSHPSVADRVKTRMVSLAECLTLKSDILIIQRASVPNPDMAKDIITHCRSASIRLVLELDDDLLNLHQKTGDDVSYANGFLDALEMVARHADTVVVSSSPLGDVMRQFNKNVVCVPNVHDERIWLEKGPNGFIRPMKAVGNTIRILYMGTKTHEHDLKLIQPAYDRIREEYGKKVELEIVGGIPDHVDGFARKVKPRGIGANSDAYCEFVEWFRDVNHWDIGVIPLELTPFNRKKSYIKFLDYAALGVPAICTDIEPYREVVRDGDNGLLVTNDTESWYRAMKRLIDSPELRNRLAENAFRDLTGKHILLHRAGDFLRAIAEGR